MNPVLLTYLLGMLPAYLAHSYCLHRFSTTAHEYLALWANISLSVLGAGLWPLMAVVGLLSWPARMIRDKTKTQYQINEERTLKFKQEQRELSDERQRLRDFCESEGIPLSGL